ncbi:hypothetical protein AX16_010214 [Volvariella volvacea WC 439]|nr:hypothetical protein AX16_010214 [Volvariella volvacea WC 439]
MDTTSTAISRVLYILACHQEAQEKLRKELRECKAEIGGQLSYNELDSLPYLDAVCRETLRLYPPVSTLSRTTRKDVILPFSNPIRGVDGREMTEVLVPKDTNVIISIIGANRNPAMWGPDAEEWKPERWMSALPEEVAKAHMPGVYSHLMTFLGGSRACIGFKFAQLELKAVLSVIVDKFNVELSDKEIQWAMASITAPYVVGDNSGKPKLPLKFSFA